LSEFEEIFGRVPDTVASAPGRVNLIGEHTDYNGGYVLPLAIPQRTRVELARREDELARVVSANVDEGAPLSFELGHEKREGRWLDYVQGSVLALRGAGFIISGFDARIASEVPVGSGLSSSAALEVGVLRALRAAFDLDLGPVRIAMIAHRAETEFVGAPVGIMDQMASSLASEERALFLDTRTLDFKEVPLPSDAELLVIDSGVKHEHATGHYSTRRAECEAAARLLGVQELRDVTDPGQASRLPAPLKARARHVITENARVLSAIAAMDASDSETLGALLNASHASLRDDFEVSTVDVDRLVQLAQMEPDVFGARMTGGGFGGAIVALARRGAGRRVAERIRHAYDAAGRPKATVLLPN
jgi:galactokinase